MFIVVSGYSLMLPVLRHGGTGGPGGIGGFTLRRTRRIVPPYLIVVAASSLVILVDADLRRRSFSGYDLSLDSFTFGKIASHLGLFHNVVHDWQYAFNAPLWTIGLEFQIYFVFALLLLPIWRRWGLSPVVALSFAVAVLLTAIGGGYARPWMLGMFALGMVAAVVGTSPTVAAWRERVPWRGLTVALIALVPVVSALTSVTDDKYGALMVCHTAVGLATCAGMILMSREQLTGVPRSAVHRLLASRSLRWLGVISFSLYLVHYPIVGVAGISFTRDLHLTAPENLLVLTTICVPASLAVAFGFHRAVERRFMNTPPPTLEVGSAADHLGAATAVPR